MIQDRINLYEDYSLLNLTCYSCGMKNHFASECGIIHYDVDHLALIKQYRDVEYQFRKGFVRPKRNFKMKGKYLESLQQAAGRICDKYSEYMLLNLYDSNENQLTLNQVNSQKYIQNDEKPEAFHKISAYEPYKNKKKTTFKILHQSISDIQEPTEEIELDRICEYSAYFPHNNFSMVMERIAERKQAILDLFNIQENSESQSEACSDQELNELDKKAPIEPIIDSKKEGESKMLLFQKELEIIKKPRPKLFSFFGIKSLNVNQIKETEMPIKNSPYFEPDSKKTLFFPNILNKLEHHDHYRINTIINTNTHFNRTDVKNDTGTYDIQKENEFDNLNSPNPLINKNRTEMD